MRSTPMTVSPRSSRRSARCEPMNPATPVTRALRMHFLPRGRRGRKGVPTELGEEPSICLGTALDREALLTALTAARAVIATQAGVGGVAVDRAGEGLLVARVDEDAGVAYDLGEGAVARGYDRSSRAHRLDSHHPERLDEG